MRTQTEEAFGKMFEEMLGDLKGMIRIIGLAVVFSLLCVAGNSMAMSMRERTSEVAVLKAIGFNRRLVLFMVLTEAVLVAGLGGAIGSLGVQGLLRLGRSLAVHRRVSPVLLRSLEHCAPGTGRLAFHRAGQRSLSGAFGRPISRSIDGLRRVI